MQLDTNSHNHLREKILAHGIDPNSPYGVAVIAAVMDCPRYSQVIEAPMTAHVPIGQSHQYITAALLANRTTKENAEIIKAYISRLAEHAQTTYATKLNTPQPAALPYYPVEITYNA